MGAQWEARADGMPLSLARAVIFMPEIFKGISRYAPDIARRIRVPASGPTEVYQRTFWSTISVSDSVPTPLMPTRLGALSFSLQAGVGNTVEIVFGGREVMISTGFRLAPGAVLSAQVTETDLLQWALGRGRTTSGMMPDTAEQDRQMRASLTRPFDAHEDHLVCNLADFGVIARPAGGVAQTAILSWTTYARVDYRR